MIIGSNIVFAPNMPSTNTYAAGLLSGGRVQEGTIIRTDFQSAGRGQPGSSWESEKGKNLLFSIILYPSMISLENQFLISMALSVGIRDYVHHQTGESSIKWPNDIYVKDDKIAGILIENSVMDNRIASCIAGIGLNVNQEVFSSGIPNPVSLKQITGKEYDPEKCIADLAAELDRWYGILESGDKERIRNEYKSRLYRFEHWHKYKDEEGKFAGRITDVENDGRLLMERSNGSIKHYYFREMDFIS